MTKDEKKKLINSFKSNLKQEFEEKMPVKKEILNKLTNYVDQNLRNQCDHTLKITNQFIKEENLNSAELISWLNAQGVFCDCEIFNLDDLLE